MARWAEDPTLPQSKVSEMSKPGELRVETLSYAFLRYEPQQIRRIRSAGIQVRRRSYRRHHRYRRR
jgi:hypothetical protein